MGALEDLWSIGTFRRAVVELLSLSPETLEEVARTADLSNLPLPSSVELEVRTSITAALRTLYDIARSEGVEDVQQDLERLLDSSPEDMDRLRQSLLLIPQLLKRRARYDDKTTYRRLRENSLPQVTDTDVFVSFRSFSPTDTESPVLIPMVTFHLGFDEHILGSDSISFGVPPKVFQQLAKTVAGIAKSYDQTISQLPPDLVPPEARLDFLNSHTGDDDEGAD